MGQTITLATRNDGNREQDQSRLDSLCQAQTRVNTQILPPTPQTTIIQRRHHAIDVVRCRHVRVNAGACEDDPIHTTQDVPTHHPNDKKIQEQEQKRKRREGYDGRRKKPRYAADRFRRRCKHEHWTRSRQRRFLRACSRRRHGHSRSRRGRLDRLHHMKHKKRRGEHADIQCPMLT